ncbi:MAG: hypothetical protein QHH30_04900, partial [candidate division NC10 bacterium]|nr:hypothetical protein [candidate division NC10 bacterium]
VILFPGGWFSSGAKEASILYGWIGEKVKDVLSGGKRKIVAVVGVDGRIGEFAKDQIAMAVGKEGIEAIGRKFHPAPKEKGQIELAKDHLSKEADKPRFFELGGKRYFLGACYDSFGIRHKRIPNLGIDVVLDLVHGFYPKGEGGSGDVYFAKHGFAGASKAWSCLVFGATVFFDREIPGNWPSGVYWNQGNKSTQKWRYGDNPVRPKCQFEVRTKEGVASVRIFDLDSERPAGEFHCGTNSNAGYERVSRRSDPSL